LDLSKVQRGHFYTISAGVKQRGHYNHEMCTEIWVQDEEGDVHGDDEEGIKALLRDFMRWIYKILEEEWDYMRSDEQIKESIQANEYEFEEDGTRA
jgi:hypothetical protein